VTGEVTDLLTQLDNRELATTLAAPEVSYRLLWPMHHEDLQAAGFIRDALRTAYAAARALQVEPAQWLADGSGCVDAAGRVSRPWVRPGGLPVDFGSPYALATDVSGERLRAPTLRQPLVAEEIEAVQTKLHAAAEATARAAPHAWRMALDFTKALILIPDLGAPQQFSSGSSGQFVGRSVLANPQLAKVGAVQIAEALVHEAIHAVLYMDEQHDAWVLDDALYAGPLRITSPWTGNRLPLRPFLQAAFVWYGILTLWSRVRTDDAFEPQGVRARLNEAAAGFLRGRLLDRVGPAIDRLAPELLQSVDALQGSVEAALGADAIDPAVAA
jgi:HEXXH motif-containing protein